MKLALVVVLALAAGAPGAAKKRKAPADTAVTDAAIKTLLDGEQQHIADCVVADSPPGAWAVTVKATVKINSAGQVLSTNVVFEPQRPETTRACVEKTLRALSYPKSAAPMISISREWSFAMK